MKTYVSVIFKDADGKVYKSDCGLMPTESDSPPDEMVIDSAKWMAEKIMLDRKFVRR